MSTAPPAAARHAVPASSLLLVSILMLVWGCNWPVLKLGVTELAPLTFRATTLPFAALGLLLVSKLSGDSIRISRALWIKVAALALFNIAGWNGLILFGVQQMPAGRSAILAFTMPIWSVLFSLWLLHEPLSGRKLVGLVVGMGGMALLLGEEIVNVQRAPVGAFLIIGAAMSWGFGTVLLRRWAPLVPQNTLTGWMMLLGWIPLALAAPLFDPHPSRRWRRCPAPPGSRSCSTSSLPVPSRIGRGSAWRARCRWRSARFRRCRCPWSASCPACCFSASGRGRANSLRWRWCSRRSPR